MSTKTYKFWDFRNSVIRNLYVLLHNTFLLSIIFISFVYLNKTIRIISSIVSSDFTETFLFFLLEESAVPKSSIWWGTVTKLGQFTKKKRSRLVRSSLQIPLRNEKRKEVEGGRKSCDRSRNSAGSSPVWEEIFWKKKKRDTLHACPPLSLSLFLSLSILSLRLSRLIGSKMEEKRKEGIRRDDAPLSFSLSIYLLSSIVEIDRFENSSKKREKKEEGGIRRDDALSLSLSLSLSASLCLCLSVSLSLSLSLSISLSLSVSFFLSVYSFSSIVGIDRFENPSKIHRRKEKRRRNKEGRCSSRMIPFSILFGTQG